MRIKCELVSLAHRIKRRLLVLLVLAATSTTVSAIEILDFGLYTSDKPSEMIRQFRPVINHLEINLSRILGEEIDIRIQVASSYELGIEDLVQGRVDFARFGPASYVIAKSLDENIGIIAIEHKNGSKQFNGVICVSQDSGINSVDNLAGKSFAFGNERSTIGRYLSQQYLVDNGLTAKDLAAYEYLDRHDLVGSAVAARRYDAGALKESTFKKLVDQGANLQTIATFPNVTKPWVSRSGLEDKVYLAVRETLLQLTSPEALSALKKDGFLEGSDSDYDIIRRAIENNSLFFE